MDMCENFYVALGFKEDCIKLISEFETSENLKFLDFCHIWNEMRFSCVFGGRATHSELIEFAEEALDIAKQFISPSKSLKTKIGGIYLLYGLFFTMPVSQPKIRMVLSEWNNVIKFQRQLFQNEQYDAIYILKQLIDKDAFAYCCSEHERGLENYYLLKDFMRGNKQVAQSQRKENEWEKIFVDIDMKNQSYINKKKKLAKFSENFVPKVYDTNETKKLTDMMKKIVDGEYSLSSLISNTNSTNNTLYNKNSEIDNGPSTSKNIDSDLSNDKLDSGDDSDTSDMSDDEDQY